MQYDWKKIKVEIEKETRDVFENSFVLPAGFSFDEAVETFKKVLLCPLDREDLRLESLPNLLLTIQKILIDAELNENIRKDDNFKALADRFEPYLKKILYLIKHTVNPANTPTLALAPCIRELGLNPNRLTYTVTDLHINEKRNFGEHLWRAYNIRNEVHYAPPKNRKEFWSGVQSYLVMYLYAAHKHRQAILQAVEPYFLSNYLKQYIADFKQWQTQFVPIAGMEFEKIELWATEVPEEERTKQGQDKPDDEKKKPKQHLPKQPRRGGTIDELRRTIREKQMVVMAEPGMGKSTSLQYIAYTDAIAIESGHSGTPYPVYIELKLFQAGDIIQTLIEKKLGIDAGVTANLLTEGKVTLLLDGLNEVAAAHVAEAVKAISRFMSDFPDVFVVITTRPNAYERYYFDQIAKREKAPIFQLQQMEQPQIEEFLQKNSNNEATRIILDAITQNEALKNIIKTPLLLKMLITVVSRQPKDAIPPTETGIILSFIDGICNWEQQQNAAFKPDEFMNRLAYLAHQCRMRNEANTAIAESEINMLLQNEAPKWELQAMVKKAAELRLLAYDTAEGKYSFVHEIYQEALWAKQQVQFDKYPPAANIQYVPAIELWHKTGFKEALRLYSALLTEQKRFDFVSELGKRDVLLAARCKTACWHPEPELRQMIIERAKLFAVFFEDVPNWSAEGFLALMELIEDSSICDLLIVLNSEVSSPYDNIPAAWGSIMSAYPTKCIELIRLCLELGTYNIMGLLLITEVFASEDAIVRDEEIIVNIVDKLWKIDRFDDIITIEGSIDFKALSDEKAKLLIVTWLKDGFKPNYELTKSNDINAKFTDIANWDDELLKITKKYNLFDLVKKSGILIEEFEKEYKKRFTPITDIEEEMNWKEFSLPSFVQIQNEDEELTLVDIITDRDASFSNEEIETTLTKAFDSNSIVGRIYALEIIEKCNLQNKFPINMYFKFFIYDKYFINLEYLSKIIRVYSIQEDELIGAILEQEYDMQIIVLKFIFTTFATSDNNKIKFINLLLSKHKFLLAKKYIELYEIENIFDVSDIGNAIIIEKTNKIINIFLDKVQKWENYYSDYSEYLPWIRYDLCLNYHQDVQIYFEILNMKAQMKYYNLNLKKENRCDFINVIIYLNIKIAKLWVDEWGIGSEFPIEKFIDKAVEYHNIVMAWKWVKEYSLQKKYAPEYLIELALLSNHKVINEADELVEQWKYVINWMRKYKITNRYLVISYCLHSLIDSLNYNPKSKDFGIIDKKKKLSKLFQVVYWKSEIRKTLLQAIEKRHLDLASKWIYYFGDWEFFIDIDFIATLINRTLEVGETETAQYWVQKYNLYEQFPQFEPPGEVATQDLPPPEEA